jgi:hypothetical protein
MGSCKSNTRVTPHCKRYEYLLYQMEQDKINQFNIINQLNCVKINKNKKTYSAKYKEIFPIIEEKITNTMNTIEKELTINDVLNSQILHDMYNGTKSDDETTTGNNSFNNDDNSSDKCIINDGLQSQKLQNMYDEYSNDTMYNNLNIDVNKSSSTKSLSTTSSSFSLYLSSPGSTESVSNKFSPNKINNSNINNFVQAF